MEGVEGMEMVSTLLLMPMIAMWHLTSPVAYIDPALTNKFEGAG